MHLLYDTIRFGKILFVRISFYTKIIWPSIVLKCRNYDCFKMKSIVTIILIFLQFQVAQLASLSQPAIITESQTSWAHLDITDGDHHMFLATSRFLSAWNYYLLFKWSDYKISFWRSQRLVFNTRDKAVVFITCFLKAN